VGPGDPRGGHDPLHVGIGHCHGDVFADRAAEEEAVLGHHADPVAQKQRVHVAQVDVVDGDDALLRVVEALDELGDGALARAAPAHDADHLAGLDGKAHPVEDERPVVA